MLKEIALRTPKAIIAEAIYSKLLGLQRSDDESDLATDSSSENLNQLLIRFVYHYGQPPGISRAEDFKALRREFAIALRHKTDHYNLCMEVAKQALEKGLPYVMYGVSPAARMLKTATKEVIVEVTRAKSLRFASHPDEKSIYWADFNVRHNTADLILNYFAKRFPMRILLIYSRREVFWLKDGQVYSQDIGTFSITSIDPKFQERPLYKAAH